jgi:hypothetical protein
MFLQLLEPFLGTGEVIPEADCNVQVFYLLLVVLILLMELLQISRTSWLVERAFPARLKLFLYKC